MARILSFPFRFTPAGPVATVEQGSDQANAEQIAVLCMTVLGERPLEPGFGITDPTFTGVEPSEVIAAITAYGPDVTVDEVTADYDSQVTQLVQVDFTSGGTAS